MKRLILHIGSGKCGSSSLQSYLSLNFTSPKPLCNKAGQSVAYALLLPDRVLLGSDLRASAESSVAKYCASASLATFDRQTFTLRLQELAELTRDIDMVILSCEAWGHEGNSFNASLFAQCCVPLDLIFVVRPPVDLINAAWWQWGVWTGVPVEDWCRSEVTFADYMSHLSAWQAVGAGDRTKIIELSQDPIQQTLKFLEFDPSELPPTRRLNEATNAHLLKHLIRSQSVYNRTVHAPEIEFLLNAVLKLPKDVPPLVLSRELAEFVTEEVIRSSQQVIALISAEFPIQPEIERKYLDPNYYSHAPRVRYEDWILESYPEQFLVDLVALACNASNSTNRLREELAATSETIGKLKDELSGLQQKLDDANRNSEKLLQK